MSVTIESRGLEKLDEFFRTAEDKAMRAAVLATNDTALFARRLTSQEIRRRINFPLRYLIGDGGQNARLRISKKASARDLEAVVTGRDRPTSLARFAKTRPTFGRRRSPIRVAVGAGGGSQQLDRAFFMRLRRGNAEISEGESNVGLAVRLRPGERLANKRNTVPVGRGVYLLYGPSVGQAMRQLLPDELNAIGDYYEDRFAHQFERTL